MARCEALAERCTLDQLLDGRDPKEGFQQGRAFRRAEEGACRACSRTPNWIDHLGGGPRGVAEPVATGMSKKTVLTETAKLDIRIPRDREGTFDPKLIARYQRRFPGFDDKIVSMYARGMSTREIIGHLRELYGIEVSPDLISDGDGRGAGGGRRLAEPSAGGGLPAGLLRRAAGQDPDEGMVRNKAVHIALGVRADGTKEILGLWLEQNEGAKFWLRVMNELRNRGVEDILIAVVDGLKGFPDAITGRLPRRRSSRPASCICCAKAWSSSPRRIESRRGGAEGDLPGDGRRRRRGRARRLRGRRLGPKISRHRPELAARLGRGHPVLRLPGRRSAGSSTPRTP